jgi:hypothetical protein
MKLEEVNKRTKEAVDFLVAAAKHIIAQLLCPVQRSLMQRQRFRKAPSAHRVRR